MTAAVGRMREMVPRRQAADLSAYPDLVVIYLGMRARTPRGALTILKYGPRIRRSAAAKPDGLLRHEMLMWGLGPPHVGMRQYWARLRRPRAVGAPRAARRVVVRAAGGHGRHRVLARGVPPAGRYGVGPPRHAADRLLRVRPRRGRQGFAVLRPA